MEYTARLAMPISPDRLQPVSFGTTCSSARFKKAIKPMDKASEAILALKPVTFRYKELTRRHAAVWLDR